jgi:hypothetical protein
MQLYPILKMGRIEGEGMKKFGLIIFSLFFVSLLHAKKPINKEDKNSFKESGSCKMDGCQLRCKNKLLEDDNWKIMNRKEIGYFTIHYLQSGVAVYKLNEGPFYGQGLYSLSVNLKEYSCEMLNIKNIDFS